MDIRQLKHFVAVAEHGHFTMAAKSLNIAQPALSISIKKFEQQLGVQLFKRCERHIELTSEGEVLYPHAKRILQQIDDAKLAMDELIGLEKGEVRLGAPSMMGSYFFPEILMAFKTHYPNLKLTLIDAGTQSIRKMLLAGELDIGVIVDQDIPDDLEVDHLVDVEMVGVVGEHHPLAQNESISYADFFANELVMFKPGYFHRDFIDKVSSEYGYTPRLSFETNLIPMILNILKREFAITALLKLVTDNETGIVGIPFEERVELGLALAWRKEGYQSKADKTFIDFVKQYV
ncbi:LysR family transcriptional regulator [Vibrio sp. SCSIO 43135]|uniref:LysR family transcriptional regulator n=1 Tax=Vibrio sp. SCSIO 43135 TaxID=2819096 RepID=UPI002075CA5B|nr:LysR family transcriptional regulator [Vibrio sp. SCSIO 43135]USD42416.1 LysR family transcriptional regulator [Vibrio sp. SCSIO 43135]